ncbi:MAG: ThiF family adenylyltransferase [Candidatus Eisenbacteria bacterium]
MIRLALTFDDVCKLAGFLDRARPNETGAFLLVSEMRTHLGLRIVARDLILPDDSAWVVAERHRLVPSGQLISQVVSRAVEENAGVLFVHSHPDSGHPTEFSSVDDEALRQLSVALEDLIDGPFVAAVVGPRGWVARRYHGPDWDPIDRVTAAGRGVRVLDPSPNPPDHAALFDDRQQLALGELNTRLRNLDVAVVGCGGLGSPLAETLTRMGVRRLTLMDPDRLDTPSNISRVLGRRRRTWRLRNKATVVANHCRSIGMRTDVEAVPEDVRTEAAFQRLLDHDVVFSATDTHSSRAVMNVLSYAFHLTVIDGGCRIGCTPAGLAGLLSEVRIIGPGLPCLLCRGTLDPGTIRAELLPELDRTALEREGYIIGSSAGPVPSAAALTVLGAGMMASTLLAYLSSHSEVLSGGYVVDALMEDVPRRSLRDRCLDECIVVRSEGLGWQAPLGAIPPSSSS